MEINKIHNENCLDTMARMENNFIDLTVTIVAAVTDNGCTKITPRKGINKMRLYVQVKNAYTLTKYTGFDPEIPGGILETGVDRGAYPQPRTYAVGLDIKF